MSMHSIALLFTVLVLVYTSFAASDVIVKDLKIFVDGEEFFIKAMCYHPTPLGIKSMNAATLSGGGGRCSVKRTPYGEWLSACFDRYSAVYIISYCSCSDFFDGSNDIPTRYPPGPKGT